MRASLLCGEAPALLPMRASPVEHQLRPAAMPQDPGCSFLGSAALEASEVGAQWCELAFTGPSRMQQAACCFSVCRLRILGAHFWGVPLLRQQLLARKLL
jgi:hypothetical protein